MHEPVNPNNISEFDGNSLKTVTKHLSSSVIGSIYFTNILEINKAQQAQAFIKTH